MDRRGWAVCVSHEIVKILVVLCSCVLCVCCVCVCVCMCVCAGGGYGEGGLQNTSQDAARLIQCTQVV